jgi:opacity protein-like surface antigen
MRRLLAGLGLCAVALPTTALAQDRARVFLNGSFAPTSLDFAETRTFTEFAEEGKIDLRYQSDPGPGGELGLQYFFARHFGLGTSFYLSKRDGKASYDASLPHPLYLARPRKATGDVPGLSYKENAALVDLIVRTGSSPLELMLAGGVSFFKVEADLVERIAYTQQYPYDSVTVTGVPTSKFSDSPIGWNVSGSVDYRIGRRFGLGVQARFSRAKAKLIPVTGQTVEIDAGGLQLGGGLRLYF